MGGLGVGRGLCRGRVVAGGGRLSRTPLAAFEVIWQVVRSWLRRDCVPSRAIAWREVSSDWEVGSSRGFGSLTRMLPKSKV